MKNKESEKLAWSLAYAGPSVKLVEKFLSRNFLKNILRFKGFFYSKLEV
jgi:hypothetical protein